MRAVLDTNVIISGLLSPAGNARLVLAMAFARKFYLIVSAELFAEYETVIERPRCRFRPDEIHEALTELRRVGNRPVCGDADDGKTSDYATRIRRLSIQRFSPDSE